MTGRGRGKTRFFFFFFSMYRAANHQTTNASSNAEDRLGIPRGGKLFYIYIFQATFFCFGLSHNHGRFGSCGSSSIFNLPTRNKNKKNMRHTDTMALKGWLAEHNSTHLDGISPCRNNSKKQKLTRTEPSKKKIVNAIVDSEIFQRK